MGADEVKPLFANANMKAQEGMLLGALKFAVENMEKPDEISSALRVMGERHEGYKAEPRHYPMVGDALLKTFAEYLGDKWTPELETAWSEAYEAIAGLMIEEYKKQVA